MNKTSFFVATLNNIFDKNYEKYYNSSNEFLKYVYIFTFSSNFIISTSLQQKLQPFENVNNLLLISATLSNISKKTYEKTSHFYNIFSKSILNCTHLQIFLKKHGSPFKMITIPYFISATLTNICDKTYEKTYHFFSIFWNFQFIFTCLQNFMIRKFKKTKCCQFQYVNKILFIAASLNNIFGKNYEKT